MPHTRNRHFYNIFKKKLAFSPVVTIQGPRQSGKSYFVREILGSQGDAITYVTFDHKPTRDFASASPDTFIKQHSDTILAIDEAQKVPDIFDAVKYEVDQNRRPGRYILLGSTEFSREFQIRESMTGRISRMRIFPLNLAETLELPANPTQSGFGLNKKPRVTRKEFLRHLSQGGLPAMFAVRSSSQRDELVRDWISTTVNRDLHQFPKIKADSDLAQEILQQIAILDNPEAGVVAKMLKRAPRRVQQHIDLLEQLFVLQHVAPLPYSTGKNRYFLCDAAIARELGASFEKQLITQLIIERLSQGQYSKGAVPNLKYYRSQKGAVTHLVEETDKTINAIMIIGEDRIDFEKLKRMTAFKVKAIKNLAESGILKSVHLYALTALQEPVTVHGVKVHPWEAIA